MKVYGPYKRKQDGRLIVRVGVFPNLKTMSYARYLMEQHLDRPLLDTETVDHINRDKTDDRIKNLQVIERSKHSSIDHVKVKLIEIICIGCGQKVMKKGGNLDHNEKLGKSGPFCSKSCAGKYSHVPQKRMRVSYKGKREYYYKDKLLELAADSYKFSDRKRWAK